MKVFSNYMDMRVWSIPARHINEQVDADHVADVIGRAASQEGLILHGSDVVGIRSELTGRNDQFGVELCRAIHRNFGVSPMVMLYNETANSNSLASLCALVDQHSRNSSGVVVIQGAAH